MIISARLATARRTTLTTCLCAALAAGAGVRHAGALPGLHEANASAPRAGAHAFLPFAAVPSHREPAVADRIGASANIIPVTSCEDDGSNGTLRKAYDDNGLKDSPIRTE